MLFVQLLTRTSHPPPESISSDVNSATSLPPSIYVIYQSKVQNCYTPMLISSFKFQLCHNNLNMREKTIEAAEGWRLLRRSVRESEIEGIGRLEFLKK
jgi:hypothetical protein